MKELITMWRNTRMVVLVAVSAAAYAAVLIPFKGIVLVPGLTEVRPGAVVPVVFGILFGPAAAWGCGIGNVIADMFGMFGPGSIPGFFGNFFFAFVAYKLWGALPFISSGQPPAMRNVRQIVEYVVIAVISSVAIAGIIGWGVNILKLFPMSIMSIIIFINNSLAALILGPFLLWLLYPRIERWDMLWHEIMPEEDYRSKTGRKLGVLIMVFSIILATGAGVVLSTVAYQDQLGASFKSVYSSRDTSQSESAAEAESVEIQEQKEAPPNLLAASYGLPEKGNTTNTAALLISGLFFLIFLIGCLLA